MVRSHVEYWYVDQSFLSLPGPPNSKLVRPLTSFLGTQPTSDSARCELNAIRHLYTH